MTEYGLNGQPVLLEEDPALVWVDVPGGVKLKVHKGFADVAVYVATRFHREVEKLKDGQCWGYSYRPANAGDGAWSSHSTGWALDFNSNGAGSQLWGDEKLKATDAQLAAMNKIADDLGLLWGGPTYAGGDYSKPENWDPMHFDLPRGVDNPTEWCKAALAAAPPLDNVSTGKKDKYVPTLYKVGASRYRAIFGDRYIGVPESLALKLAKIHGLPIVPLTDAEDAALAKLQSEV